MGKLSASAPEGRCHGSENQAIARQVWGLKNFVRCLYIYSLYRKPIPPLDENAPQQD